MKKLLAFFSVLSIAINMAGQSSGQVTIHDTLHYFFNKQYFRQGTSFADFSYYKSPAATGTAVTHVGSRFENFDTIIVTGLEAFAADNPKGAPTEPVHLYLCTLDVNNLPVWPAIDSVVTVVLHPYFTKVGGELMNGPVKIARDFAVLFRNMSELAGDSVRLLRTSGKWSGSTYPSLEKFSDGFGYARFAGIFSSATNYTASGFGPGTDYEFCVAPWVTYELKSEQEMPQEVIQGDTTCVFTPLIFKNKSSGRYVHRQYNLNEFYFKWSPFINSPQTTGGWSGDAPITWKFEAEDAIDGRISLGPLGGPPAGTSGPPNQITFMTDSVNPGGVCFTANQFRARLRPMSIFGRVPQYVYNEDFDLCTRYCNGTALDIKKISMKSVFVFPNPMLNVLEIKGIFGSTEIKITDLTGRVLYVSTISGDGKIYPELKAGLYQLELSNAADRQTIKIIVAD